MNLPMSIDDALIIMPAGTAKTAIKADIVQLKSDLEAAIASGALLPVAGSLYFENLLSGFAQGIAANTVHV